MKYKDIPYVCLVKTKNKWGFWGACKDSPDAHKMYDMADYEEKKLLHFGEVIRERKKVTTSLADVCIITKKDLLRMLENA